MQRNMKGRLLTLCKIAKLQHSYIKFYDGRNPVYFFILYKQKGSPFKPREAKLFKANYEAKTDYLLLNRHAVAYHQCL